MKKKQDRARRHNQLIGQVTSVKLWLGAAADLPSTTPHAKNLANQALATTEMLLAEIRRARVEEDGSEKVFEQ